MQDSCEGHGKSFQDISPRHEVHWYFEELAARVVADSGRAADRHHLGKILLRTLKDDPDFVAQIDGATGERRTNRQLLEQTVRCAAGLRALGVRAQDVVLLQAPSGLDLLVPFYASFYIGAITAAIPDSREDYERVLTLTAPKVIFCRRAKADDISRALGALGRGARLVTFDEGGPHTHLAAFLEKHGHESVDNFRATDLDPVESIATLVSTGATTGRSKFNAISHRSAIIGGLNRWSNNTRFPTPTRLLLAGGELAFSNTNSTFVMAPILRVPVLLTSAPLTQHHFYSLLRTYKPTWAYVIAPLMTDLLRPGGGAPGELEGGEPGGLGGGARGELGGDVRGELGGDARGELGGDARGELGGDARGELGGDARGELGGDARGELGGDARGELGGDARGELGGDARGELGGDARGELGCLEVLVLGGTMVTKELVWKIKKIAPKTTVVIAYGASEAATYIFSMVETPLECVGRPAPCLQYKLVDPDTEEEIREPHRKGELWLKGPSLFKGYYGQPEETAEVFTADGWFKTGDILRRDQHWNFFFYERVKFLLKYSYEQVSPTELENVIRLHPGVQEVVVAQVPGVRAGGLVAFVEREPGAAVGAADIKGLLARTLFQFEPATAQAAPDTDGVASAALVRGVAFPRRLPRAPSGKLARAALASFKDDVQLL